MKVWGLSEAQIRAAVSEAGLVVYDDYGTPPPPLRRDGRALRVRLGVDRRQPRDAEGLLPFQRRTRQGRRIAAVSWEGHREFMRIVFRDHPEARIKSAIADYKGRDCFWETHPSTKGAWGGPGY